MSTSLIVFVEIGHHAPKPGKSTGPLMNWSTVIQMRWPESADLYRSLGHAAQENSENKEAMFPLRGIPFDISQAAKNYINTVKTTQVSWLLMEEVTQLQTALAQLDTMPTFRATMAFARQYHDTQQVRIVYCFVDN